MLAVQYRIQENPSKNFEPSASTVEIPRTWVVHTRFHDATVVATWTSKRREKCPRWSKRAE